MIKTPAQRVGLALVGLMMGGFFAFRLLSNPATVDSAKSGPGDRTGELQQAVDPNTADEAALASIPGLSRATAKNIVDYREEYFVKHPGESPFKTAEDLEPVKGIGSATIKKAAPFLYFP